MALNRLEQLKEQKAKIEARIQLVEARSKVKERKQDTRRKILIGSYYLDKTVKENKMDDLKKILDKFLKRDSDRTLFNLEPLEKTEETEETEETKETEEETKEKMRKKE